MAATLGISLDSEEVQGRVRLARERGQDLRPALRAIARAGVGHSRVRFTTGRDPDGRPWKPSRKPAGQTLIASGLLMRSISDRPPTADSVEWGSNLKYAGVHQAGATIHAKPGGALHFQIAGQHITVSKVDIPKRSFLGANAENMAEFAQILLRHTGGPLVGEAG